MGATGFFGRRTTAELLRNDDDAHLTIAARDESHLGELAALLGGRDERLATLSWDVTTGDPPAQEIQEADVIISCAGPGYVTEAPSAGAAVEGGTHYLSLNADDVAVPAVLSLDAAATQAGVTVVSGAGVSPGLTDLLAATVASEMERVQRIEISLALSARDGGGDASLQHLISAMTRRPGAVLQGRYNDQDVDRTPRLVYFPEPVGWVETIPLPHPEVLMLDRLWPQLDALTYRFGFIERAAMDPLRAVAASGLAGTESRRRALTNIASSVRPVLQRIRPGPAWSSIRVDVWGRKEDKDVQESLGVVDHLVNLTHLPLVFGAIEIASGRSLGSGVRCLGAAVEPGRLLDRLDERGVRVARLEPVAV